MDEVEASAPNPYRRLPLYLLLDCSDSLDRSEIAMVSEGVSNLYRALMREPQAVETVYISVIRFAHFAEQDELIPLTEFIPPALTTGQGCGLGAALHVLHESILDDLRENLPVLKGDYRPIVFLLLGGEPTDNWRDEAVALRRLHDNRHPTVIALACSEHVDMSILAELTEYSFQLRSVTSEVMVGFFQWLSGSVIAVTSAIGEQGGVRERFSPPTAVATTLSRNALPTEKEMVEEGEDDDTPRP